MSREVGHAGLERAEILHPERVLGDAAVHFERPHCRHDDGGSGFQPGLAALDVEEFLRAEIGAEPRLGHDIVGELERGFGRHDRIAAVRDIGEGAAMHQRRRTFERLDEIGLDRLLEQRRHRAFRLEVGRRHRRLRVGVADHHPPEPAFEVVDVGREAERRHDFGGDRDVEAVLAGEAVGRAAEADHDFSKRTVVHVEHAPPGDAAQVEAERVAPVDVVVDHRREQVVRRSDGVEIAGKVQVDRVHRHDLGVAAASRAALHAEAWTRAKARAGRRWSSCRSG